jgi:hypothetical protein
MSNMGNVREIQTELDGYLDRLAANGATEDELLAVIESWDVFDADWTPEVRKRQTRATDAQLRAGILASRVEFLHGTTDDDVWEPGMETPNGSVEAILAWVGDDPDRAYAVYQTERGGFDRSELLTRLESMLDAC